MFVDLPHYNPASKSILTVISDLPHSLHRRFSLQVLRVSNLRSLSPINGSEMQIFVKSAHTVYRSYHAFDVTCSNIRSCASELSIEPKLAIRAAKKFLMDMDSKKKAGKAGAEIPVSGRKDAEIIAVSLAMGVRSKFVRRSVTLTVEPTMTIGALKSTLKSHPWIPKEDLILVEPRGRVPLDDRNSIDDYGIKDGSTLLACMGGSFSVKVCFLIYDVYIPVSSCFATIGDLKDKIHQMKGAGDLYFGGKLLVNQDGTPLVSLGIVNPYLREVYRPLLSFSGRALAWMEGIYYC